MLRVNPANGIVWTDATANAWKACVNVSEGCANCWAEDMMIRFGHTPEPWLVQHIEENLDVYVEHRSEVTDPLDRLDPQWIFCPSSSDPYLPWLPKETQEAWFTGLAVSDQHCFQVLTKWGAEVRNPDRDEEIKEMIPKNPPWPDHMMLGVSVETPRRRYRIDWLRDQDVPVKFVSFEPLIERIDEVDLTGIDWAIVGGESEVDPEARRDMDPEWARHLYDLCREQDVAFLFKQHSGAHAQKGTKLAIPGAYKEIHHFPDMPEGVLDAPEEFLEG